MWKLPEEPRKRTRVCLRLALLAPVLASALSGTFVAFYSEIPSVQTACPPWVVQVVLASSALCGAAGAAYASLQLPLRFWRRIAAALAAFVLAYLLSGMLFIVFSQILTFALKRITATGD